MLSALVDNAVKFSPYGGTVTVVARRTENTVEVTVEDEGVGIPQSEQELIFSKFYRGGDTSAGTGLGLFIARGLVSKMGGHMSVRVRGGQRLSVHVRAPACGGRERRFGWKCQGYSDGVARGGFLTRVLVIDDEAPIRLLCRVNLEAEKMEVVEAKDGPTGLEEAKRTDPDVILLDVMMPMLDGWRVAEHLLDDPKTKDIPIIFLTARAEFRDRARGLDIGGIDYVTKPFNPLELATLVRNLLDRIERGERDDLRKEKLSELRALMESE